MCFYSVNITDWKHKMLLIFLSTALLYNFTYCYKFTKAKMKTNYQVTSNTQMLQAIHKC